VNGVRVDQLDLTNRTGLRETPPMPTDRFAAPVSWGDFAAVEPDLAAAGARHLDRSTGAALLATVRGDAAPRLHPVTVGIVGDGLFVFLLDSAKRRDLAADGRYALHAHQDQGAPDEFSVRGRARLVPMGELRERVAAGWFFEVDDTYWLFELRVQSAILGERAADEWPPRYRRWSASTSDQHEAG
jgi:Pyridoxamine 5'-phosphate oxidase